jgi:hypothetical protein
MSRFIYRWAARVAVGLALAVGLVPVAAAHPAQQASDPAAVASAFIGTFDPGARMGMVADDVTLSIIPAPPGTPGVWSGKQQAAALFGFSKSQIVHLELAGSWQVSGDKVSGTVMVTTNDFIKYNVGAVQHQYDFVVQNGKIKSFTSTMALFERPRVQAAAQAYAAAHPAPAPVGMPATGEPQALLPLLIAMGMLILTLGAALRRRNA